MKRFMAALATAGLLTAVLPAAAQAAPTATGSTAVGLHNAYTQETAPYLVDVLDRNPGMVEIDVWTNFFGTRDFQVGHDPGNHNNCSNATTYEGLRSGSRDQNLAGCLRNIRLWHDRNPNHAPVVLKVEVKNGFDGRAGFGVPQFDALLASSLGAGNVFGPANLKGGYADLDTASRAGAWPTRSALAGKFVVIVENGTFELQNPFDNYDTDLEVADRLIAANTAGALASALSFPAINGASATDPRTGDRGGARKPWMVAFDGSAASYAGFGGGPYLGGGYLVVMTDAHDVAPAIDSRTPAAADAQARVRQLSALGATIVSSDWTSPEILSYTAS
ncbi:Ca2+-dependent phosphoinositide-specific phospholipase C [Umezawaea sp. Da 62-37]|uniref:Ca2+-dependent phosphoinositide-specific phospholipase C n=1 Tax=Umezawaea sp. Da 62-37 TaxID=3075927 RepID=UPI0028F6CC62|nr:Ca2+-dependent phosphoinositide-specific phospholipase C [Umezawaea sp. Da 62-37]WNV84082.1 Ca2+-dependent phosphoinositide-specific phospholipase C [Umezawaea sp. Da 62-37]